MYMLEYLTIGRVWNCIALSGNACVKQQTKASIVVCVCVRKYVAHHMYMYNSKKSCRVKDSYIQTLIFLDQPGLIFFGIASCFSLHKTTKDEFAPYANI